MNFPEALARSLAAIFLVVGHLAASHFIAARLVPAPAFLLRWVATFVTGMFLATLGFHFLAALGLFTLPAALVAMGLLLAVVFGPRWARDLAAHDRAREGDVWRRAWRLLRRSPRQGWIYAFVAAAATTVVRPWVVPPLAWDSYVYHAMKAGLWVHEGGLAFLRGIGSWAAYRNYPAGGEVFTAWGMLPFHDDLLAVAPEAVMWIGVILAAIALARELGVREPYATAAAGAFATLPPLRLLVGSAYIEPGQCVVLLAGLAFTLRYLRRAEAGALVLAAAALGLAIGFKITMLPYAAIGLGFAGIRALWRRDRALIAAVIVFLVAGAPWYVYNTIDTGLPFTPFPVTVFGVRLGDSVLSTGIEAMAKTFKAFDWNAEKTVFWKTFALGSHQPEALGMAALLPLGVFVLSWPLFVRRRPLAAILVLLVFAANLVNLYSREAAPLRHFWPESVSRFWLPALAVAIAASVTWCARWRPAGRVYLSLLLGMTFYHLLRAVHYGHAQYDDRALLVVALALIVAVHLVRWLPRGAWRWAGGVAAAAILLALFDGYRAARRFEAFGRSLAIHPTPTVWIPLARAVDHPDRPHRVAVTGGPMQGRESWYGYALLGTRLQNELFYLPVTRGGEIVEDYARLPKVADRGAWLARLRRSGADFVVSFQAGTVEATWMEKLPETFEKIAGDGGRGVWRVKPLTPQREAARPGRR